VLVLLAHATGHVVDAPEPIQDGPPDSVPRVRGKLNHPVWIVFFRGIDQSQVSGLHKIAKLDMIWQTLPDPSSYRCHQMEISND
jgi:hypothetical protein